MSYEISQNLDRQAELKNCTFVKTILMLLVVFYHSILFWNGTWLNIKPAFSASLLSPIAGWLNTVHIQGFALVSGYLFFYLKYEQGKYGAFLPFVKNKAKRLLIPYLFAAVVWVIPIGYLFFRIDVSVIINGYLLARNPSQLWFLVMLFMVFAMFWPLSDFFYKKPFSGAVAVLGCYGCGLLGNMVLPNVFQIWTALRYVPLFWLGFQLRQHGTGIVRKIPAVLWLIASVLLYALTKWLDGSDAVVLRVAAMGFGFVTRVIGALTAFVVLQKLADKIHWDRPVFAFLSKHSMVIYLFHQQVIYLLIWPLNGLLNPYLHAGVNFVGAMAISALIAALLMKFRATRLLVGEK